MELRNGLDESTHRPRLQDKARLAFAFDTNAIYRVGLNGTRGAGAVDYLRQQHKAPVIIPGQAIQEAWNNYLAGVEPQARKLRGKFDDLTKEMQSIGLAMGPTGERARDALDLLIAEHGDWIDPASHAVFISTLDALLAVGTTSYVPRAEFYGLARIRKETKCPPGFRDAGSNYGDFFLWSDFLYGLARANLGGLEGVVLVTNDTKADWSRHGVAHPVLVAEAVAVSGLPFRLWTVQDFHSYVDALPGRGSDA